VLALNQCCVENPLKSFFNSIAGSARAQSIDDPTIDDPLHGYCSGVGQCVDNGTNSPTSINPALKFGFTVSPGPASGDLLIDVLVPNNLVSIPSSLSYALTGTLTGTATLFGATAWTSGNLATYLGINASPNNSIGAYLPSTKALDSGATGFYVYQVNLGTTTLQGASNPNSLPLENLSSSLLLASYIVGFLNEGTTSKPKWIATANSGAIFETGFPPTHGGGDTPLPGALLLMGTVLAGASGVGGWRRKRKNSAALAA
jgi:hypothetical protein